MSIALGPECADCGQAQSLPSRTAQHFDKAIGDLAAAVESFVDDQSLLLNLPVKLAHQLILTSRTSVRNINVTDFSAGGVFDFLSFGLNPREVAQAGLAGKGANQDFAGAVLGWLAVY